MKSATEKKSKMITCANCQREFDAAHGVGGKKCPYCGETVFTGRFVSYLAGKEKRRKPKSAPSSRDSED